MIKRSVPTGLLEVRPRAARAAVAALDVSQTPLDLRGGVGAPVGAGRRHLRAGQRLRDAVRARILVLGVYVPVALAVPEVDKATELIIAEAEAGQHLAGDILGAAGRHIGSGHGRWLGALGANMLDLGDRLLDDGLRHQFAALLGAVDHRDLPRLVGGAHDTRRCHLGFARRQR